MHKGNDWRIAIEQPALVQGEKAQIVVPLHNLGMATSGDYRNYFEDEQGNRLRISLIRKHYVRSSII